MSHNLWYFLLEAIHMLARMRVILARSPLWQAGPSLTQMMIEIWIAFTLALLWQYWKDKRAERARLERSQ